MFLNRQGDFNLEMGKAWERLGSAFFLIPIGADTFQFSHFLDEGVRVFLLEPNDPVSLQSIQANSYTELTSPNIYRFAEGTDYFVGLYTGNGYPHPQTGIYPDPLYGWAQLANEGGTIQLIDGALAYGADGIYAGTRTLITIPEPGTGLLALLGGGALALARRFRHKGLSPP